MNESFCCSSQTGVSWCWCPWENLTYGFLLTSPTMPNISCTYSLRWRIRGYIAALLWGATSRICSKQHAAFWWSSHVTFSPDVWFETKECHYIKVLTLLQFGRTITGEHRISIKSCWNEDKRNTCRKQKMTDRALSDKFEQC